MKFYPDLVWRQLRSQNLLPKYIVSAAPGTFTHTSYLQQVIIPLERSCGQYKVTLGFLGLEKDLVLDSQKEE